MNKIMFQHYESHTAEAKKIISRAAPTAVEGVMGYVRLRLIKLKY